MTLKTRICFTFQMLLKVPNQITYRWGKFFPFISEFKWLWCRYCDPRLLLGKGHCPFNIRSADVEATKEPNKAAICSRAIEGQHEHECVVLCLWLRDTRERKASLKRVVRGRFGPLNVVYSLANGPCGVIDDGREVLLDDDAKKILTITLASKV